MSVSVVWTIEPSPPIVCIYRLAIVASRSQLGAHHRVDSHWSSVELVPPVDFLLLSSNPLKSLLLFQVQPGDHLINSAHASFSLIEVSIINPGITRVNLGSVVFLNVENVCVIDVFLYFSVLKLHFVNIFPDLVHSSSQSFVHFLVSMVCSYIDSYLFAGRILGLEIRNVRLDLLSLVPEEIKLPIKRVSDIEEVLRLDNFSMDVVKLGLKMLNLADDNIFRHILLGCLFFKWFNVFFLFLNIGIGYQSFNHFLRRYKGIHISFGCRLYICGSIIGRGGDCGGGFHLHVKERFKSQVNR